MRHNSSSYTYGIFHRGRATMLSRGCVSIPPRNSFDPTWTRHRGPMDNNRRISKVSAGRSSIDRGPFRSFSFDPLIDRIVIVISTHTHTHAQTHTSSKYIGCATASSRTFENPGELLDRLDRTIYEPRRSVLAACKCIEIERASEREEKRERGRKKKEKGEEDAARGERSRHAPAFRKPRVRTPNL